MYTHFRLQRRLVAILSQGKPGFNPGLVHVRYVAVEDALDMFFS
jgi:hypothetical protein